MRRGSNEIHSIWFQAVQNVSATESGIRNLPLVLSVTVFSIIAGICTTVFGQYAPWIILASVLTSVGAGLISTFGVSTGIGAWLGYQIIYGAGVGTGIQSPLMAVQVVLDKKDIATGTAIIVRLHYTCFRCRTTILTIACRFSSKHSVVRSVSPLPKMSS